MASVWNRLGYGPLGMLTTEYLDYAVDKETHIIIVGRAIHWAGNLEPQEMDKAAVPLTLLRLLLCFLTVVQREQPPPMLQLLGLSGTHIL